MRVLILGAGPAGLTAAMSLRELSPARSLDPEIVMVSAESFPPYSPPAMANHFLTGREESLYWQGEDVCDRLRVDYRSGVSVRSVEPDRKRVVLGNGDELGYDQLVIATGSRLYAPLDGYDLPGTYNFKSLAAASDLVEHARKGDVKTALIVGGGFIGVEVAILLRELGLDVTLVQRRWVMPRMLDEETGGLVLDDLERRGIDVRTYLPATRFLGHKRVEGVEVSNGEVLTADAYIAATGVKPNADYLADSAFDIDWGVRVDDRMRTSLPDIWAAGDVAETIDRASGERYVHATWPNAREQGDLVARDILGYDVQYAGAEKMNSMKHLGLPIVAIGEADGERVLRRRKGDELRKIFITDNRIVGCRLAGDIRAAGFYRTMMLRKTDIGRFGESLLDPRIGLHRC